MSQIMDMAKFQATHQWVKDELKSSVDFWLKYGMDRGARRRIHLH